MRVNDAYPLQIGEGISTFNVHIDWIVDRESFNPLQIGEGISTATEAVLEKGNFLVSIPFRSGRAFLP